MQRIQFYNAGRLTPYALHASYEGLATSLRPDDEPWLLLARADRGHISLGASQYADAELDLAACRLRRIPIVQRALGGGTVWVDHQQLCLFFIFPRASAPRSHLALFDECLKILSETFARVGVTAERVGGQDLWCGGRKLLGSGAATLGQSMVFGASLLEHFDASSFAACIRTPSSGFAAWLEDALSSGMTDLATLGVLPLSDAWVSALYDVCDTRWGIERGTLRTDQRTAMAEAEHALRQPLELGGRRLVRGGIKINRETYLLEDSERPWIRILSSSGRLDRLASADKDIDAVLQTCHQRPFDAAKLQDSAHAHGFSDKQAQALVQRVKNLCTIPRRDA